VSKSLVEIQGFAELQNRLKSLPDKVKRSEVLKILGQAANTTVKAAKKLAPVSKKPHIQKRKGQRFGIYITPGNLSKSIGKKTMSRSRVPMLVVRARSHKKNDGWYGRQMIIRGTKKIESNPFIDKAFEETKGKVAAEAEQKVAKYIQKRIDKLN
jgi:HK97 gp10 family phage protein